MGQKAVLRPRVVTRCVASGHGSAPDARGPAERRSARPEGPRLAEEASGDRQTQGWEEIN